MTRRAVGAALLLIAALPVRSGFAQESTTYKGLLLVEALQELQARGLRIVFSSAIVRSDLRVTAEPRATEPERQLEELLAAHDLGVQEGPGGILQVVASKARGRQREQTRGSLEGRVLDARTGTPLAGVLVRMDGYRVEAQTNAAGQFAVKELPAGTRIVTASAAGYIPARRTVTVDRGALANVTLRLVRAEHEYREFVSVTDFLPSRTDRGVASQASLDRDDFARLHGSVIEDPLRAVHAFPGVTAVDDFGSDFVVRGSPFRHVDLVVDGVSTDWLRHTVFGRGASGSLMMLSGLVVESATLRTGAYPRRHGDRLGSELDLSLRQGSREAFAMRGAIGGAHAVLAVEGPIGGVSPTGSARGSWLVSARQSYLEWPPERSASSRTPFGFSDGVAKIVFDVRPTQQVTLTALGGISSADNDDDDDPAPNDVTDGINQASAVSLSWRSTLGPAFVIRQRASLVSQHARNSGLGEQTTDVSANQSIAYRTELSRSMGGSMLEAGGLVERMRTRQRPRPAADTVLDRSSWLQSSFLHFAWAATPSITVSPGGRVTWSTLMHSPTVSRWLLAEWSFHPGWSLIGSAGASRQPPDLGYVLDGTETPQLRPERAVHVETGIEQTMANGIRWRATIFNRREADVIQSPELDPRLVANALVFPTSGQRHANALQGTSRGLELLASRRSPLGLSGWATYAFGRTRQSDAARRETYWADFDQRHSFNVFAHYRLSPSTSLGATFRAGSNFPISGYFAERNGRLLAGHQRNQVRLPSYARLDLRASRQFQSFGRSFTVFAEALNVMNRANVGLAAGSIDSATGEATGFTETLLQRRMSAGVVFEF